MSSEKNEFPEIILRLVAIQEEIENQVAEVIAEHARERVPYDPALPHHIRDAIHLDPQPEGTYVVAGDKDVFWAHFVEHGTVNMPAHPFLVPATEETLPEAERIADTLIKRTVG